MTLIRNILVGVIAVIVFLLFIRWNEFQEKQIALVVADDTTISSSSAAQSASTSTPTQSISSFSTASDSSGSTEIEVPQGIDETPSSEAVELSKARPQLIYVKTDTLHMTIDTKGGDIVKVALPKFLDKLEEGSGPFTLLNRTKSHTYTAESELLVAGKLAGTKGRLTYHSAKTEFQLDEDQDKLVVDLSVTDNNLKVIKRFTFKRDSYLVDVDFIVDNKSTKTLPIRFLGQIKRDNYKPTKSSAFAMQPFIGAALTTPEKNYKKYDFDDLDDLTKEENVEIVGGWIALVQHYFVSAWIPDNEARNNYYLSKNSGLYVLKFVSGSQTIEPGSIGSLHSSFYAGPKNLKTMESISEHLALTLDFGWLWFIAKPLFQFLDWIHGIVGNWGIAIILLTVLIKLIFLYPTAVSYKSMAKMRKIGPKMQELKERYGEDKQKMSSELMKLYKKEGANPVSGCLPMLLPMPVFIALYWVLMESVELRHSPFFFWIEDLSVKDPFFVLPLIMGASMYFMQKLNPTPPDPTQAKVMQMMPIFFTFMFLWFPAGLVLYWVVNNLLSMTQQYLITKKIEKET